MTTPIEQFKAAFKRVEDYRKAVEAKGQAWTEAEAAEYQGLLGAADRAKIMAEASVKEDELKKWGDASLGSVFNGSRTAGPTEGAIDGVTGQPGDGELYGTNSAGEMKAAILKSGEYKDAFNAYLRGKALRGDDWRSAMKASHMKVLLEGQDNAGGYWVPIDQRSELVKKVASITGVKNDAYHFTTGSDIVKFPKVVYTSAPSDDPLSNIFTTGIRFSNGPENPSADISEATNPAAGTIDIPVHLQTAAVIVTRQLMEDNSFDVLGYVSQAMGESMGLQEDYWSILGTGVGQPQGITLHANATTASSSNGGMYVPSAVSAGVAWSGSAGDITKGILGLEAALPPQYDAGAKFYATKKTYAAIRAVNATTAGIQWALGDFYPNAANGYAPSLLGHPIVKDQFVAELAANSLSAIFGDVSGYFMPERVGISVEVLREIRALRDQVVLYGRRRLGGQLVKDWQVKLLKAATS